jgi:hypothetical protein
MQTTIDLTESSQGSVVVLPTLDRTTFCSSRLFIYIEDRERNRNMTPRDLRLELSRIVETGPLRQIWPRGVPKASIEEKSLRSGDFAFYVVNQSDELLRQIPVWIERKRIGDLVQRSYTKDHWFQLQRMRDEASHTNGLCLFLLEGDLRCAAQYIPYGAQSEQSRSPLSHTVDDEDSLSSFMARAVLSSRFVRFHQAKDEQKRSDHLVL